MDTNDIMSTAAAAAVPELGAVEALSKINADIGDVKVGVGDINNNKSVGKELAVEDGEVNITVSNDNSKTVNRNLMSRFADTANVLKTSVDTKTLPDKTNDVSYGG